MKLDLDLHDGAAPKLTGTSNIDQTTGLPSVIFYGCIDLFFSVSHKYLLYRTLREWVLLSPGKYQTTADGWDRTSLDNTDNIISLSLISSKNVEYDWQLFFSGPPKASNVSASQISVTVRHKSTPTDWQRYSHSFIVYGRWLIRCMLIHLVTRKRAHRDGQSSFGTRKCHKF